MAQEFLKGELLLESQSAFARVSPWGATLTELVINGDQVIQHASKPDVANSFAGVTLAPWPNRLAGGTWNFKGEALTAPANDGKGNANHGLVFDRKFEIEEQSASRVKFSIQLGSDLVYPFDVSVEVTYELIGEELSSEISATNKGSVAAPIALGTHPYFNVFPDSEIYISAASQAVNNAAQIPVGAEPVKIKPGAKFAELNLDDCFMNLVRDSKGIAETRIVKSNGREVTLWQDASFKYLMVYTHPHLGIAIEPQTAPANAFNSGEDLTWLEPGATISASWGIRVNSELEEIA